MQNQFNSRVTRSALVAAMTMALVTVGGTAIAGTTDTMTVSAQVTASCSISVTQNLDFGAYDPQSATDTTSTGKIATTCTAGTPAVTVALDEGLNPDGASTPAAPLRQMDSVTTPGTMLKYALYQDAATTVWGSDPSTVYTAPAAATGGADEVTVYGVLAKNQTGAIADTYGDTVTATVSF